jgi:hypothetical protein
MAETYYTNLTGEALFDKLSFTTPGPISVNIIPLTEQIVFFFTTEATSPDYPIEIRLVDPTDSEFPYYEYQSIGNSLYLLSIQKPTAGRWLITVENPLFMKMQVQSFALISKSE